MKTLIQQSSFIQNLLGKQEIKTDLQYRRLQFLEFCEQDDIYLAYNMLTRQLVQLSDKEYAFLSSNKFTYTDECDDLISDWFAVPIDNDDIKLYDQSFALYNIFDNENYIDSYTILTTTDCNARCFYCYEKGIKHIDMSVKTAHDVASFIISNSKDKKAKLALFGGEPLYNIDAINIITDDLKKAGKSFSCSMTSNGYLLNDEVVSIAKERWNLKCVQITLDGTQEIYNKCKNYVYDDPNPFETVCNNIERLLINDIAVKIRLNLDVHNYKDLYNLCDYISKRFAGHEKLFAYVSLLYDLKHQRTKEQKQMLIEHVINLENKLYSAGIFKCGLGKNSLKVFCCMADSKHSTLINPEGKLGRCEHYINDYLWGTIYEPEYNSTVFNEWKSVNNHTNECISCPYYVECLVPEKCVAAMNECDCYDRELRSIRMKRTMHATFKNIIANETIRDTGDGSLC